MGRRAWRWRVIGAVLASALFGGACGGGDGGEQASGPATATARPAEARPAVAEQLAILDESRDPAPYAAALDSLARRCRESREALADAVVAARRELRQERDLEVSVLDYLRGVDRVVPADQTGVACVEVVWELGRAIGR